MCSLWAQTNSPTGLPLEKVRLQLKWTHQFQFAGYYAALEKGYYRDAGLDVELIEAEPGVDPVATVLQGKAEYGVGTSNLLLARAAGKPVVVLGVIYQHSPLMLVARNDVGVGDIHDLATKPIMVAPEEEDIYAYFKNEGVDPAKLKIIQHSFDLNDLINNKVPAISAYSTDEPFRLRAAGVGFIEFSPREGGIDFYGDNLFTSEQQIRDHPDQVRAFRAASLRGWDYAVTHQDEIVDLILRKYNRGRSREQLAFEAQQTVRLMHPDLIEVGYMNPGRWQHISDTYEELGMLPHPVDLKKFLYNPNPKPDLTFLYTLLVIFGCVAAGALFWLFPLLYLNRKLRREITRRAVVETELLAAKEKSDEAHAAQSRFLAVMSHEVRSPIGGISKLLDLILQDQPTLPEAVREDLHAVQQSAQSLYHLVDGIMEWSRCEARGVEVELGLVPVKPFAEDLRRLFLPLAETKKLSLTCVVEPGVPDTIFSDGLRLRQILANLLANAIKFTTEGSVTLTVRPVTPEKMDEVRLFFEVKDTGMGIPEEAQQRLFKPYQQADSSIARKFGGSGLGLSISLHLAKLLGGTITVQSRVGEGSTFRLEIAAESVTEAAVTQFLPEVSDVRREK